MASDSDVVMPGASPPVGSLSARGLVSSGLWLPWPLPPELQGLLPGMA
jgi:hypothetical protein